MKTISFRSLTLALLLVSHSALQAAQQWETLTPFPRVFGYAVTYGNGKFVTIPGFGYSPDNGLNWYQGGYGAASLDNPPYLIFSTYTKLIFGGGRFLALANTGQASTSIDGIHWAGSRILPDPGVASGWDVAFGAGRFVAISSVAGFATSTDGEHWDRITGVSTNRPLMLTFGNGKFLVALGSSASSQFISFAESSDGLHWTTRPAPPLYMSADCQTNSCLQMTSALGMTFSAGKFVIAAYAPSKFTLISSPDGVTWTPGEPFTISNQGRSTVNLFHDVNGTVQQDNIEFANGVYVTVGPQILRGPSLSELAPVPQGFDMMTIYSLAAHGQTIIAAGVATHRDSSSGQYSYPPVFFISTNGARTFEARINLTSAVIHKLIYANGKFLAVGENGVIAESTLGLDWNDLPSPVTSTFGDIATGNGLWVIGSDSGPLWSADGIHFAKSSITNSMQNIGFGAGIFVASGASNSFFTSTNGNTWTASQSPASGFGGPVAYGNGRFISGSNLSFDGLTWQTATQTNRAVVFLNGNFYSIAAPPNSSVTSFYSSTDGLSWTAAPAPVERVLEVSDGAIWLCTDSQIGSPPGIWRWASPSIHLEAEALNAGNVGIRLDVPEPARYRIQRSATIEGPWQSGNLLDIGFRAGWDEAAADANSTQYFKVARE